MKRERKKMQGLANMHNYCFPIFLFFGKKEEKKMQFLMQGLANLPN
jgi:hypothetical protein